MKKKFESISSNIERRKCGKWQHQAMKAAASKKRIKSKRWRKYQHGENKRKASSGIEKRVKISAASMQHRSEKQA